MAHPHQLSGLEPISPRKRSSSVAGLPSTGQENHHSRDRVSNKHGSLTRERRHPLKPTTRGNIRGPAPATGSRLAEKGPKASGTEHVLEPRWTLSADYLRDTASKAMEVLQLAPTSRDTCVGPGAATLPVDPLLSQAPEAESVAAAYPAEGVTSRFDWMPSGDELADMMRSIDPNILDPSRSPSPEAKPEIVVKPLGEVDTSPHAMPFTEGTEDITRYMDPRLLETWEPPPAPE